MLLAAVMIGSWLSDSGDIGLGDLAARSNGSTAVEDNAAQLSAFKLSSSQAICACYDDAFRSAASSQLSALSAHYKTGFLICRRIAGYDGGEAWTAGWEARKSARPFETSCRSYRRKAG